MNVVKNTIVVFGLILFISTGFAVEAILKGGINHQANAELLANPEAKADYIKTKKKTATLVEEKQLKIPVIRTVTQNNSDIKRETLPHNDILDWNTRFPSTISYDEGSGGSWGGFIFNEGDSMAVWYRPSTDCMVEGVEIIFYETTELIGTDVTIVVREVLDVTSEGIPANGEYDFTMYGVSPGDFMGDVVATYTMPLTSSDVGVLLDIAFDTAADVGANDFAIQVIGNMGGDEPDFTYWAGVNGAGIPYNHGFKYYAGGASYCSSGCWVPRLNFGMAAKVDYYGDPPPFVTEVENLPDVYASCDGGPYEPTVHIEDVGTAEFTGALTSVVFSYDAGGEACVDTDDGATDSYGDSCAAWYDDNPQDCCSGADCPYNDDDFDSMEMCCACGGGSGGTGGTMSTELVGTDVEGVFTGYIPSQAVGTTVSYWWTAVDNGDENPDTSAAMIHTTDLSLSPLSFTVKEMTSGADVLVLDDGPNPEDASFAGRISDALYGLGYSTDFWNTKSGGMLSECGMNYYDYIVLVQGLNGYGNMGLDSELEMYMKSRLDAGGNLLMTSVDYIYGITEGNEDWNSVDQGYDFLANYLHVSDYWSDTNYDVFGQSTDTLYRGIADNVLTGNIGEFQMHSPENSNWSDQVIPDDDAESIFEVYSDAEEDWVDFGGVMYEGDFKTVFVPWHLEGIDDDEVLNTFLDNTMMWFGTEHAPVISNLSGPTGPTFSTEDQVVTASVVDGDGDAFTVTLNYSVNGGEYMAMAMTDNGDGTFTGSLSGQDGGVSVNYYLQASDDGGFTESSMVNYFIYQPASTVLLVLNNEMDPDGYPGYYYLSNYQNYLEGDEFTLFGTPDFWPYSVYGSVTAELLAFYNTVIEITTTADYPLYGSYSGHSDLMLSWLNEGGKNYVLAGDETFGIANQSWADVTYEPGSFFYEIGVHATMNDLAAGGVSPLWTNEMYGLAGAMQEYLPDGDTLTYDPEYEIDFANWMDGATPTMGTFTSLVDANGNAIVTHREWDNGNKTVFMGIDPISLNSVPNYYWYGASDKGILAMALNWFGEIDLAIDNNIFELPQEFKLYQNHPNPFNPSTIINFDIAQITDVKLIIYNLLGKEIVTLVNDQMKPGAYSQIWNGKNNIGINVPSGVYFYRMTTNQFTETNKMILMK